jgi:uncharacterized membrane protein YdbT with pleckstrin-like domain
MLTDKIQLDTDERVLTYVRKHWLILLGKISGLVLAAIAPPVLMFFFITLPDSAPILEAIAPYRSYATPLYAIWLIFIWMGLFNAWTDYYLDIWTVTNRRLITVDQQGLFSRIIGSFRFERLQDINVEIHGIVATLFNFGTIEAQTAGGSEEEFRADGLPKPRELRATILRAADDLMDGYRDRPRHLKDGT